MSAGTTISFSMTWRDQGFSGRKGRVGIFENTGGTNLQRHYQSSVAPHVSTAATFEYTLDEDVQNLEFRYRVGGGGGHELHIDNFQWTISGIFERFSLPSNLNSNDKLVVFATVDVGFCSQGSKLLFGQLGRGCCAYPIDYHDYQWEKAHLLSRPKLTE